MHEVMINICIYSNRFEFSRINTFHERVLPKGILCSLSNFKSYPLLLTSGFNVINPLTTKSSFYTKNIAIIPVKTRLKTLGLLFY